MAAWVMAVVFAVSGAQTAFAATSYVNSVSITLDVTPTVGESLPDLDVGYNSDMQRVKFGANAQPFYVLIDNEGKPLNKSYSYDEDIPKYIEFLQTGLENYKKEK